MNIFYLDHDPLKAAQYHCDKHVVKMILETAQLLSGVIHVNSPQDARCKSLYKLTHKNHPCAVWARTSDANYSWLWNLGLYLCKEYTYRYGKTHASQKIIELCSLKGPSIETITQPALAMPPEFHDPDPVFAYRQYYANAKASLLRYTNREFPSWLHMHA